MGHVCNYVLWGATNFFNRFKEVYDQDSLRTTAVTRFVILLWLQTVRMLSVYRSSSGFGKGVTSSLCCTLAKLWRFTITFYVVLWKTGLENAAEIISKWWCCINRTIVCKNSAYVNKPACNLLGVWRDPICLAISDLSRYKGPAIHNVIFHPTPLRYFPMVSLGKHALEIWVSTFARLQCLCIKH